MSTRPLLMLTMIVKDEAATLAGTLRSVRPHIDGWCIVDTGSTDGSQALILRELSDVPGKPVEAPFVDFSTTRNFGLSRCDAGADFILWLDADDVLTGGEALRAYLAEARGKPASCHDVQVEMSGTVFDSARVLRPESLFRFAASVHEVLVHPQGELPAPRIPGVKIHHHLPPASEAHSRQRWDRDLALLRAELASTPNKTRAAFYLGMTLRWLGRHADAMAALRTRVALGGWVEEV
jgi:glycosyltransferase involved in cell wall biosynthesis